LKVDENDTSKNAIDQSYEKLKTQLTPLDKNSELYKQLSTYATRGHDMNYFSNFKVEVQDIFEVVREEETERWKKWMNSQNRYLLWHGSRLTNFVGILSQGLRIAPPEAPKTGYRFGKGVYFADIISKSASYCFANPQKPVGLMLLNEVALGNINKLTRDEYMEQPPKNFESTQALGRTVPDPKGDIRTADGMLIPSGAPVPFNINSSCTHNEYIVYNVEQIHTRYLLKIKFH